MGIDGVHGNTVHTTRNGGKIKVAIRKITGDPRSASSSGIRDRPAGAGIAAEICPHDSAAAFPFQELIQGGCVKYCDPGALSPSSVSS